MAPLDDRSAELSLEPLRRLAHALVLERGSADDLVQEAWLAALEARGEIRHLRGWLSGAMRRIARNRSRAALRRDERERRAARPEREPSALESSARIEILREVLAAVERLPRPQREAVMLRYLDDLPPREIARRLGIPVNTARTHVRRGLERLRADLDAGPGRDREAFLAALVPLLVPGSPAPGASGSNLLRSWSRTAMQHPLALSLSVLALVATGWFLQPSREPGGTRVALEVAADPLVPGAESAERALSPAAAQEQPAPPAAQRVAADEGWTVRGHVNEGGAAELVGRVFAGIEAAGAPLREERFRADANGDFAWRIAAPETLVTVELSGDRTTHDGRPYLERFVPGDAPPDDALLTLYPLDATLRGRVLDAAGAPLAGVSVGQLGHELKSASDGSFVLPWSSRFPREGAINAWLAGFAPGHASVDPGMPPAELSFELRLHPERRVSGTVRDRDGAPVAGAKVWVAQQDLPEAGPTLHRDQTTGMVTVRRAGGPPRPGGWPRATTDASGRYELGGIHPQSEELVLVARSPGHLSAELTCERVSIAGDRERDFALERGTTVRGVVRSDAAPVWGAQVTVGDQPLRLEGVEAWTDREGRFTLEGVPAGAQHLWIALGDRLYRRHDVSVRAGSTEVEVALASGGSVAGVVLDALGAPAPWTRITAKDPTGAEPPAFYAFDTTDAAGRFRFTDLPGARVVLRVERVQQEVALERDDVVLRLKQDSAPPANLRVTEIPIAGGATKAWTTRTNTAPVPAEPVVPVSASTGTGGITGRLEDAAGNLLREQEIELAAVESSVEGGPWRVLTDLRGAFAFERVPAGTFDLRWVRREAELEALDLETRVTLVDGEQRLADLRPQGKSTLRGRFEFFDPPGATAADPDEDAPPASIPALVALELVRVKGGAPQPGRRGTFAREGAFEFVAVEPGDWAVHAELVFAPGKRGTAMSRVRVPAEGVAEVVVKIPRPR